jgi:hypothetical protein
MKARSVSRCIAVAAHGKRCQQTPFRGSPYCWHHTQSRKVWAPSRPAPTPARGAGDRRAAEDERPTPLHGGADLRETARALAREMVDELDGHELAALVDFLESDRPGALFLAREDGQILVGGDMTRRRRGRAATA